MFNLAIDSKLRGCDVITIDVITIKVEDVAASGYTADRATIRQKKTGRPVRFELSEQTRQAVDDYLKVANKRPGEFLFTGRRGTERSMSTRQYARPRLGMDRPRWTRPQAFRDAFAPANKGQVDLPSYGQFKGCPTSAWPYQIEGTVRHLGIEVDDALAIAEQVDV
jgi:integrase